MEILFAISAAFTGFFLILLINKHDKVQADYFLIAWFSIILLNVIGFYVLETQWSRASLILELSDAFSALHAPILLLYTISLTSGNVSYNKKLLLHLSPFIFHVLIVSFPILFYGELVYPLAREFSAGIKYSQFGLYAVISLLLLRKYQENLPQLFSFFESIYLRWLQYIIGSIMILWMIAIGSLAFSYLTQIEIPHYGGLITNIFISVWIVSLGYFGLRQTHIFSFHLMPPSSPITPMRDMQIDLPASDSSTIAVKYQKSGLEERKAKDYYPTLLDYMVEQKPYLDNQLSLLKLSEALSITPNHLSQIINTQAQENFYDFVNRHRVEEVKTRIRSGQFKHQSLLGIGLDCGFYSKASFNRAFKKLTGMTPSAFKRSLSQ